MNQDSPVAALLERAGLGVESAWQEIVDRFSPLVFAVCRRYGIGGADAQDVSGAVWLRLVSHAKTIRDPRGLPGWLQTTTRNECLQLLRHHKRQIPTDTLSAGSFATELDANLIHEERRTAARQAFAQLSRSDQALLSMLFSDPPKTYKEISAALGIPVGAIGPTRARCLARVRRNPTIAALHDLQSEQLAS
ncbi:MAG: RNA polymerase sigma factor [Labedaea sp.]